MEQTVIIDKINNLIKSFNRLDKETKNENKTMLRFLQDQKAAALLGKIEWFSAWAPQVLYKLRDDDGKKSVRDYRLSMGDRLELVEGFEEIKVLVY